MGVLERDSHLPPYRLHLSDYTVCADSSLYGGDNFRTSGGYHMFVFTALPFKFWTWQIVNEGLDIKAGSLSLSLLPTTFPLCVSQLCLCDLCFLCLFFFLSSLSRSCSCRLLLDLHSLLLLLSLSDSFLSLFLLFFFAFFSWRISVKNKEVAQKSSFNT